MLLKWLAALLPVVSDSPSNLLLLKWLCLCLAKLSDNMPDVATAAVRDGAADLLAGLLTAQLPELRAAAGGLLLGGCDCGAGGGLGGVFPVTEDGGRCFLSARLAALLHTDVVG